MRIVDVSIVLSCLIACGPGPRERTCMGAECDAGACEPGEVRDCYTASKDTVGVGPCATGVQTCSAAEEWGNCVGQVVPAPEVCGDGVDNNCDGAADNDEDRDGDGFTTCAGDCCDSVECSAPALVNPTSFDAADNRVDDDCNGVVDDTIAICDGGLASDSATATDYAKAMDICQVTTRADATWGLISATLTYPDGTGTPDANARAIRGRFGNTVGPRGGVSMALLSSGVAASKGDIKPSYHDFVSYTSTHVSGFPADFVAANGDTLPNAPGCPRPDGDQAHDPVMLTLELRVPANARSFSLNTNFFSAEFPEYTCSRFNDFFVVLLDSSYTGTPANPSDGNLAFYTAPDLKNYPVGVNLAHGNTGLFTQCVNGTTGCSSRFSGGMTGAVTSCVSTEQLLGTGMDDPANGSCDTTATVGGATGWLITRGNVVPGEIIKLRIAIWDTSDHRLDSLAIVDGFQWSVDTAQPGTVILR